ncbi:hypothetical protein Sbs19_44690 [Sphingobium sp. BS19]|nr:hypothetical protein Sbs19_44690 [Sphingobium sp. BS19]
MGRAFIKRNNLIRAQAAQLSGEQANRSPGPQLDAAFPAIDFGAGNLKSLMVPDI